MTYWSRMLRISRGVGRSDLAPLPPLSPAVSSRMMSLQSSMHSSQMNTDGPAMSLRTSCWLLPQNEQYNSLSPVDLSAIKMYASRICRFTLRGSDPLLQDLVDDPVFLRVLRPQEVVTAGTGLARLL